MGSVFRKGSKETGQSAGISQDQNVLAATQSRLAQELFNQTAPLRSQGFGDLTSFLKGGTPSFLVGPSQDVSSQIAQLGRQVQESGVRGGQLRRTLATLPMQRMGLLDQLRAGAFDTALNAGMGGATAAFGGMNSAMSGMGNAAANLNNLGAQRIQQNMALQQGLGGLAGSGIGALAKFCWVAERLYGASDKRTALLRFWLSVHRPSWWFTKLYRRIGQWVSRQPWCPVLRPVFDGLLRQARRDCYGHGW